MNTAAENRALRFALTTALALAVAYGLAFPLPFLAPLFVIMLSMSPGPPMGPKALIALVLVVSLALGVGLLMIPVLTYYPATGVLLVAVGLFLSMYMVLILGKRALGMFLTIGFTLISVAGTVDYALGKLVVDALVLGLVTTVVCQWLVYPFFPEPAAATVSEEAPVSADSSTWLAIRATLIVMPAYLLALTNPSQYLMTIMKSVSLGQQASMVDARHAGRELIGSTFIGGIMAVVFWKLLSIHPTLWMYFLWMLAFALYAGCKLFGLLRATVAPSFWVNAVVTMLILLGPAVEDSANGQDAASAFFVRFATFIAVTLYAWAAIYVLESWRLRRSSSLRGVEPLSP